jgi:hypothetical protein
MSLHALESTLASSFLSFSDSLAAIPALHTPLNGLTFTSTGYAVFLTLFGLPVGGSSHGWTPDTQQDLLTLLTSLSFLDPAGEDIWISPRFPKARLVAPNAEQALYLTYRLTYCTRPWDSIPLPTTLPLFGKACAPSSLTTPLQTLIDQEPTR